jgi:hypothetical protein
MAAQQISGEEPSLTQSKASLSLSSVASLIFLPHSASL